MRHTSNVLLSISSALYRNNYGAISPHTCVYCLFLPPTSFPSGSRRLLSSFRTSLAPLLFSRVFVLGPGLTHAQVLHAVRRPSHHEVFICLFSLALSYLPLSHLNLSSENGRCCDSSSSSRANARRPSL